jgi:hypothetical protein
MRRSIAIFLLVILSSSLGTPLFGLSSNTDSNLPACCRRDGKHHCASQAMMGMRQSGKQMTAIGEKCPCYPCAATTAQMHSSVPPPSGVFYPSVLSHPPNSAQSRAGFRISFDRSRQKRGPPSSLSMQRVST